MGTHSDLWCVSMLGTIACPLMFVLYVAPCVLLLLLLSLSLSLFLFSRDHYHYLLILFFIFSLFLTLALSGIIYIDCH